jgi:acetyl-CoA carboxylase biotin carboxylase subunit
LIGRVLIANRGEIVLRVARTARKLGLEPCGIYSEADKESLHIKYCKEAINIGGRRPSESYLRADKIIDAAKKLGCDMIHPGYGFLAENLEFSLLCEKEGFIFVGPSPSAMKLSGDKAKAREVASRIAPILPGKEISTESDALDLANEIGYPVILKAVKGGGGRGLRVVESDEELIEAFSSSKNESLLSFGSDRLYIEKYLVNPRHIEVQILGDSNSNIVHLGERDCSIQRRHQKLIEETPSPALTSGIRVEMVENAIGIAREMAYDNAGTVEFLFKGRNFYFMEINSRIQVEHPITEEVTGIDIVEQQLHIAMSSGLNIKQEEIKFQGHAIECRINAEHPITFAPYPGRVTKFIPPPKNDGIRVDTALYSGYSIPPFYDSLIAKLICYDENRTKAIEKMKMSLLSFRISGIPSTIPFHLSALNDQQYLRGNYDTDFVNRLKPFASKEGEIAAALFSMMPKKIQILKTEQEHKKDPWLMSRYDDIQQFHHGNSDKLSSSSSSWTN